MSSVTTAATEEANGASSSSEIADRERAHARLREMILIRRFEEKCAELYSQGKIRGFLHLYVGEEAIATGVMAALREEDNVVSTYREHGHALARGVPAKAVMAEMFGKATGCSRGRGGSMHLFDVSRRFFGGNAIVAGGIPLAVGLALANAMQWRQQAEPTRAILPVTTCFFGDGATAEGAFHESLNLAALWKLPIVFLCENNQYAMGTALARYQSETDLARKAESYRITAERVDGMDVMAVEEATQRALVHAREGHLGPYFLELVTFRFRAHSMFDAELYRRHEEVDRWKLRDPVRQFVLRAVAAGWIREEDERAIESSVREEIDEAVAFAEASPWEPVSELMKDVITPSKAGAP